MIQRLRGTRETREKIDRKNRPRMKLDVLLQLGEHHLHGDVVLLVPP